MVGQRDVSRRRLVHVQPMWMRVVYAEEFETPFAEFLHQSPDLSGRNYVIPDRINRDVLRRERPRDYAALPRQNSAAFPMRLATGMLQQLPKHFAATLDGSLHCESLKVDEYANQAPDEGLSDLAPFSDKLAARRIIALNYVSGSRHQTWTVRNSSASRRRRNGRGLSRTRHPA
jgi:hypothetical protein